MLRTRTLQLPGLKTSVALERVFWQTIDALSEGEWQDWVTSMEEKRWESVLKEYKQEMKEIKDKNQFDEQVANAIAKESHR